MLRIGTALLILLAAQSSLAASGGTPWWLLSSSTGSGVRVDTAYATNATTTRLVLQGSAVTAMTTAGGTSVVTITDGFIDVGTSNNAAYGSNGVVALASATNSYVTTNSDKVVNLSNTNNSIHVQRVPDNANDAASAGWVRDLIGGGTYYFTTNPCGDCAWMNKGTNISILSTSPLAAAYTNTIAAGYTQNQYVAGGIVTNTLINLENPIAYHAHLALSGALPATHVFAHFETYYFYVGGSTTNLLGDWDSPSFEIGADIATPIQRDVPIVTPMITNNIGVVGFLKIDSIAGPAAAIQIVSGGEFASYMSLKAATPSTGGTSTPFNGGTITGNTIISNAAPELRLATGLQWSRLVQSNDNSSTWYRRQYSEVTNVSGYTAPSNSVLAYFFEQTNSTDPVITDRSTLSGQNGFVKLGTASQPTRESITNLPTQTYCYSFDGGDYITPTNWANFNLSTGWNFSVSCWYKDTSGSGAMVSKWDTSATDTGWMLQRATTVTYWTWRNTSTYMQLNIPSGTDGQWHHVAMVKTAGTSANTVTMYRDGVAQVITTNNNALSGEATSGSTIPARVGARGQDASLTSYYTGRIFLPIVATQAWSAATVTNLYLNTNPTNFLGVMAPGGQTNIVTNSLEYTVASSSQTNTFGDARLPTAIVGANITVNGAGLMLTNSSGLIVGSSGTSSVQTAMAPLGLMVTNASGVNSGCTISNAVFQGNGSGLTNLPEVVGQFDLYGLNGFVANQNYLPGWSVLFSDTDGIVVGGTYAHNRGTYKIAMVWQNDTANAGKTMSGKLSMGTATNAGNMSWNIQNGANWDLSLSSVSPGITISTYPTPFTIDSVGQPFGCLYQKDDNSGGAAGTLFVHGFVLIRQ
jgi:hypothetical protein